MGDPLSTAGRRALRAIALALSVGCRPSTPPTPDAYFSDWPADAAPRVVAKRLAENWAGRAFGFTTNAPGRYDSVVHDSEVAT